jgi:hypothetical protein
MNLEVLTLRESDAWMRVIDYCAPYDFYHLPGYHALAEEAGEGAARLIVAAQGHHTIALPILLRPVECDGLAAADGEGWQDVTSVYGYAGPLCSPQEVPDAVRLDFQAALARLLNEMRVVTVFSRLHPFFPQRRLLEGLGDFAVSRTVSIDLTQPQDVQRSKIRATDRSRINRLRREGLLCQEDPDGSYMEDFVRIYTETMHRVRAAEHYFFPREYFEGLRSAMGSRLHLFVCLRDGEAVCAGLFVACHGILQYHLGGTLDSALRAAPMKLLIDEVRLWATAQGLRELHLGGGTTPDPDDPLLYFKKAFSDRTHEFATWRWVVNPEVYQRLCTARVRRDEEHRLRPLNPHFFPAYRGPAVADCGLNGNPQAAIADPQSVVLPGELS